MSAPRWLGKPSKDRFIVVVALKLIVSFINDQVYDRLFSKLNLVYLADPQNLNLNLTLPKLLKLNFLPLFIIFCLIIFYKY